MKQAEVAARRELGNMDCERDDAGCLGVALDLGCCAGCAVWIADAAEESGIYGGGGVDAGAGDWSECGDIFDNWIGCCCGNDRCRILMSWCWFVEREHPLRKMALSIRLYLIYRDNNAIFSGIFAAGDISNAPVMSNGQTLPVEGEPVSGSFFSVLGVKPYLGRLLDDSDSRPAVGEPVVVLSFNNSRYAFDANNAVIGKTILVRGVARSIVGLLRDFLGLMLEEILPFIPIGSSPKSDAWWVWIFGRLKPGLLLAQAQAGDSSQFLSRRW